ncbi:collagen binding domain-containing protein [Levilactobacillus angrenensis]|uniref:Collagen binding domain-containing protein n=1 Tax=Levilactobacillus angrenensis TaxID=2486020 RepID=A0ABW1UCK8_9LACO|nr:collagen binding domain-containing protein [Levilactobacillus angrenensis]
MSKNSKVWRLLIGLFSLVFVLVVSQAATPAKAATNHNGADFTTSASVTNGPDFKHVDTIDIQYNLDFGSTPIHDGDTITLDFPANLRGKTPGDTFDVIDQDGTVIGKAVVSDTGVVITMNNALEGKTNDKLTLNLATKYRGDDYGEQNVVFPLENGGSSTSTINLVKDEANLSKKGVIQDNGTIKWTILVNRQEVDLENLTVSDTIGDHQELIEGITVSNAHWTSKTQYQREKPALKEDTDYKVTYNGTTGFDVKFNDTVSNLVAIDYYTKITDETLTHSGYKFRNKAVMSWGGGTGDGKYSEQANGSVSSSTGNSGSGGGDVNETNEEEEDEDTGTIDVDGGTETDEEEAAREEEEAKDEAAKEADKNASQNQAAKEKAAAKKAAAKKAAAAKAAAKAQHVAPATATQTAGTTTTRNTKLPQTREADNTVASLMGVTALLVTLGGAWIRRRF